MKEKFKVHAFGVRLHDKSGNGSSILVNFAISMGREKHLNLRQYKDSLLKKGRFSAKKQLVYTSQNHVT